MIQERHPAVAELVFGSLSRSRVPMFGGSPCTGVGRRWRLSRARVEEWTVLAGGLRPEPREPEHHEPGAQRAGWQHEVASVERNDRATSILPHLSPTRRAMLRSQSGPVAGIPISTTPSPS